MSKLCGGCVLLSLLAGAFAPAVVSAATFGAEVFGAFNRYAMDDQNDAIDAANKSGANFEKVTGSTTGGAALRMWAAPNWMFSAAWEPLRLETQSPATSTTMNLNANSIQVTGAYYFPSVSYVRYGFGAGVGRYSIRGNTTVGSTSTEVSGSGIGFHFMGLGEWSFGSSAAVTAGAGYRSADVEIEGASGATANYSGLMGRLGFAFYLPEK